MACALLALASELIYLSTMFPRHTDEDAMQEKGQRAWSELRQFVGEAQESLHASVSPEWPLVKVYIIQQ